MLADVRVIKTKIMKQTTANLFIEFTCKCPHCNSYLDIFDLEDVKYALDEIHNAPNCNLEIKCEECLENFVVSDISF